MPQEAGKAGGRAPAPLGRVQARLLLVILAAGAALRFGYVQEPFGPASLAPWREADYVQIARNFHREDANPLFPRVDWRGDTSGEVEMELPLLPWLAALAYHGFGYHEQILRVLSAVLGLAALAGFWLVARRLLDAGQALLAVALFAINPLTLTLSGSMQPEPAMLAAALAAVALLLRWRDEGTRPALLGAGALLGAAIACKAPAVHLGLLFGWVVLRRAGRSALTAPAVLLAGALAIALPAAWYAWAFQHFARTGLSLGLSNETHGPSLALLLDPLPAVSGIAALERAHVFTLPGVCLAVVAALFARGRRELPLVWYGSAALFYVVAVDTAKDSWAFYYHLLSVPPATLLMALGAAWLARQRLPLVWGSLALALVAGLVAAQLRGAFGLLEQRSARASMAELHRCSRAFASRVPETERIVVRGGPKYDEHGHPVAYNESMVFAWMDRRGFSYPADDLGVATLEELARRGGRFWLAQESDLASTPLRRAVEARFAEAGRCEGLVLYDLSRSPGATPAGP